VIFYAIYKNQQNCLTIGVTLLQIRPWKDLEVCNVATGAAGRRGLRNSGEAGSLGRAGAGRGGSRGVLGSVWGFGPGGDAAGDGRRRCTPAACGGGRRWARMRRGRGTNASWRRLSSYSRGVGHGRGRRGG
jgi:hypothetical protein